MKVYIMLPFVDVKPERFNDVLYRAKLTEDYSINFNSTQTYGFRRQDRIPYGSKWSRWRTSPSAHLWAYTIIDPETFGLYEGGK